MGPKGPNENGLARGLIQRVAESVTPGQLLTVPTMTLVGLLAMEGTAHATPTFDSTEDRSTDFDTVNSTSYDEGYYQFGAIPHNLTGGLGFKGDYASGSSSDMDSTTDGTSFTDERSDNETLIESLGNTMGSFVGPLDYSDYHDLQLVWDYSNDKMYGISGKASGSTSIVEYSGAPNGSGSIDEDTGSIFAARNGGIYEFTTTGSPTLYYSDSSYEVTGMGMFDEVNSDFVFTDGDTGEIKYHSPDGTVTGTGYYGNIFYVANADLTGTHHTVVYQSTTDSHTLHYFEITSTSPTTTEEPDTDEDGVPDSEDCAPEDADLSEESMWYVDSDRDGYGTGDGSPSCGEPEGVDGSYVEVDGDCDDTDEELHPNTQWYPDADEDGLGAGSAITVCEDPSTSDLQYVRNNDDPDDSCHTDDTDCNGSGGDPKDAECDYGYDEDLGEDGEVLSEGDTLCDVAADANEGMTYTFEVNGTTIHLVDGQIIREESETSAEFESDAKSHSYLVDIVAGVDVEVSGIASWGPGIDDMYIGANNSVNRRSKSVSEDNCINTHGIAMTTDPSLGVAVWDMAPETVVTVTDRTTGITWTFKGSDYQGEEGAGMLFFSMPDGYDANAESGLCGDLPEKEVRGQTPTEPGNCSSVPFRSGLPAALLAGLGLLRRRRES